MADVDIYENLDCFDLGHEYSKLDSINKELNETLEKLHIEVNYLKTEVETLKETQETLTRNISELYNTAKIELERKDRQIAELRQEVDNIVFRRHQKDTNFYVRDKQEKEKKRPGLTYSREKELNDNYSERNERSRSRDRKHSPYTIENEHNIDKNTATDTGYNSGKDSRNKTRSKSRDRKRNDNVGRDTKNNKRSRSRERKNSPFTKDTTNKQEKEKKRHGSPYSREKELNDNYSERNERSRSRDRKHSPYTRENEHNIDKNTGTDTGYNSGKDSRNKTRSKSRDRKRNDNVGRDTKNNKRSRSRERKNSPFTKDKTNNQEKEKKRHGSAYSIEKELNDNYSERNKRSRSRDRKHSPYTRENEHNIDKNTATDTGYNSVKDSRNKTRSKSRDRKRNDNVGRDTKNNKRSRSRERKNSPFTKDNAGGTRLLLRDKNEIAKKYETMRKESPTFNSSANVDTKKRFGEIDLFSSKNDGGYDAKTKRDRTKLHHDDKKCNHRSDRDKEHSLDYKESKTIRDGSGRYTSKSSHESKSHHKSSNNDKSSYQKSSVEESTTLINKVDVIPTNYENELQKLSYDAPADILSCSTMLVNADKQDLIREEKIIQNSNNVKAKELKCTSIASVKETRKSSLKDVSAKNTIKIADGTAIALNVQKKYISNSKPLQLSPRTNKQDNMTKSQNIGVDNIKSEISLFKMLHDAAGVTIKEINNCEKVMANIVKPELAKDLHSDDVILVLDDSINEPMDAKTMQEKCSVTITPIIQRKPNKTDNTVVNDKKVSVTDEKLVTDINKKMNDALASSLESKDITIDHSRKISINKTSKQTKSLKDNKEMKELLPNDVIASSLESKDITVDHSRKMSIDKTLKQTKEDVTTISNKKALSTTRDSRRSPSRDTKKSSQRRIKSSSPKSKKFPIDNRHIKTSTISSDYYSRPPNRECYKRPNRPQSPRGNKRSHSPIYTNSPKRTRISPKVASTSPIREVPKTDVEIPPIIPEDMELEEGECEPDYIYTNVTKLTVVEPAKDKNNKENSLENVNNTDTPPTPKLLVKEYASASKYRRRRCVVQLIE